jgi:hypothetical protein
MAPIERMDEERLASEVGTGTTPTGCAAPPGWNGVGS